MTNASKLPHWPPALERELSTSVAKKQNDKARQSFQRSRDYRNRPSTQFSDTTTGFTRAGRLEELGS
jgi:hypothetical protein